MLIYVCLCVFVCVCVSCYTGHSSCQECTIMADNWNKKSNKSDFFLFCLVCFVSLFENHGVKKTTTRKTKTKKKVKLI